MPTQFTSTVKPLNGDYTSLSAAVTGLANDITLTNIKVFSISTYSTPTITTGDTVLGQLSGATGICVLVNTTRTQILIKAIAIASFINGETIQKTSDTNVNVTISNEGDSPIIGIECYSMTDTSTVIIKDYITSATNYIHIYTPPSERHDGKWNSNKYNLHITNYNCIYDYASYVHIEGLQIKLSSSIITTDFSIYRKFGTAGQTIINNCICVGICTITGAMINGILFETINHIIKIYNNIIYGTNEKGAIWITAGISYVYNNTFVLNSVGIYGSTYSVHAKNNICYNNSWINYYPTFASDSTNNLSGPQQANAPGSNPRNGPNMFVTFVNEANNDFHLAPTDVGARNYGTDLSTDANIPFSTDIDGQTRSSVSWDIGADQSSLCPLIQIIFNVI